MEGLIHTSSRNHQVKRGPSPQIHQDQQLEHHPRRTATALRVFERAPVFRPRYRRPRRESLTVIHVGRLHIGRDECGLHAQSASGLPEASGHVELSRYL